MYLPDTTRAADLAEIDRRLADTRTVGDSRRKLENLRRRIKEQMSNKHLSSDRQALREAILRGDVKKIEFLNKKLMEYK